MNAQGDLSDVLASLFPSLRVDWAALDEAGVEAAARAQSHCSAIVRLMPDLSDLFCAHNMYGAVLALVQCKA